MKNLQAEIDKRVEFIKKVINVSNAKGIVYGNSGGKDSALVGILCKKAIDNVLGVMMPCGSSRNYNEDINDGMEVAKAFNIETITVDLSDIKTSLTKKIEKTLNLTEMAKANISPRIRMTTLYAIALTRDSLVAGTGNRSEAYMGYFTKWGDGAHDFNPIADLTVTEIYEMLAFLNAPMSVRTKAPSAALFDGQTDEKEMGITYAEIDEYLLKGKADADVKEKIEKFHAKSEHKRNMPIVFKG
jgi:NAD+ synthase